MVQSYVATIVSKANLFKNETGPTDKKDKSKEGFNQKDQKHKGRITKRANDKKGVTGKKNEWQKEKFGGKIH